MRRLAFADLRAHRLRTLLSIIAVTLGVALVTGAMTLTGTMTHAASSLSASAYDDVDAAVEARSPVHRTSDVQGASRPSLPASVVGRVTGTPGVAAAAGEVLREDVKITGAGGEVSRPAVLRCGLPVHRPRRAAPRPSGSTRAPGPPARAPSAIDAATADREGLGVGDTVRLSAGGPARSFRVSGIVRFGEVKALGMATMALFDLPTGQSLFDRRGRVDSVLTAAAPGTSAGTLRARIARELGPSARVRSGRAQDRFDLDGLKQFVSILKTILMALGIVAVVVGAVTIANALSMAVAQQQRTLALLRSVGATRRQVRRMVVVQALAIGLAGSALGLVAGFGLAQGMASLFDALGMSLPATGMSLGAGAIVAALVIGTVVPLVASLRPARRAGKVAPAAALRDAADPAPGIVGRAVRVIAGVVGAPAARLADPRVARTPQRDAPPGPHRLDGDRADDRRGVVAALAIVVSGLKGTATGQVRDHISADYVVASEAQGWGPASREALQAVGEVRGVRAVGSLALDRARVGSAEATVAGVDRAATSMVRYDIVSGTAGPAALRGPARPTSPTGTPTRSTSPWATGSRCARRPASR